MTLASSPRRSPALFVILTVCLFIAISNAQQGRRGIGPDTLPDEPQILGFGDQQFRVVPHQGLLPSVGRDFLPNGDVLVAERSGGLRIIRDGVLDPEPVRGMPEVHNAFGGRLGLWGRGRASAVRREPAGLLHVPEARPERRRGGGRGRVPGARGNVGAGARPLSTAPTP